MANENINTFQEKILNKIKNQNDKLSNYCNINLINEYEQRINEYILKNITTMTKKLESKVSKDWVNKHFLNVTKSNTFHAM